jgi:hypothetical protein
MRLPIYTGQEPADLEAAGRFNRQPARDLLLCANNLSFCASVAVFGKRIASEADMRTSKPASIHSMPSATSEIARMACARMREVGPPFFPLLSKAGLNADQIENRSIRVKARSQIKLLELVANALQDDLLGFHLARDYDLREIGLLYYVSASSETLNEALHKAVRAVSRMRAFHSNIGLPGTLRFHSTTSASNASPISTTLNFGLYPLFGPSAHQSSIDTQSNKGRAPPQKDARRIEVVPGMRDRICIEYG